MITIVSFQMEELSGAGVGNDKELTSAYTAPRI